MSERAYVFSDQEREVLEKLPCIMAVYQTIAGRTVTILTTDRMCESFGMDHEALARSLDTAMFGFVHPQDAPRISYAGRQFALGKAAYDVRYRVKLPGMSEYHLYHCTGRKRIMPDGTSLAFFFYSDESSRETQTGQIEQRYDVYQHEVIYQDVLTGLTNMPYLTLFGQEMVEKLTQAGKRAVMLCLNVSGMKAYNARYGVEAGDRLLVDIADLMRKYFPDAVLVRYYGDHFIVLGEDQDTVEKVRQFEQEYLGLVRGTRFALLFGLYCVDSGKDDVATMVERARFALQQLGTDSRRFYSVYDAELDAQYWREQHVLNCFEEARREHWIRVYYQPVYAVRGDHLVGFEALARWQDPEKGLLSPVAFIPTLEKHHLSWQLDRYILRGVLGDLREGRELGRQLYPVSVNITREDLEQEGAIGEILQDFADFGIERRMVAFEVTERDLAADDALFRAAIDRLREEGFEIWVDDFGSGYSSLNVMHDYHFDLIKMDMSFLLHLDENNGVNRVVMDAIARAADTLGIRTLAEGVETAEQLEFLRRIDCDVAQGYLYSRPRPLGELQALIESGTLEKCDGKEESGQE